MSKYMYENKSFYYFESVLLVYRISLSFTIISKLQRKKKMTHFEKYFLLSALMSSIFRGLIEIIDTFDINKLLFNFVYFNMSEPE